MYNFDERFLSTSYVDYCILYTIIITSKIPSFDFDLLLH